MVQWKIAIAAALALGSAANAAPEASFGKPIPAGKVAEVQKNVTGAPWSAVNGARNNCPVVYMLTSRTCPYCRAFFKDEFLPLTKKGVDVRLNYAPVDAENQDMMAEIAYRRDIRVTLARQTGRDLPAPPWRNGPVQRINAYIAMIDALQTTVDLSRAAGFTGYLPTFIWQDKAGSWRVHSGYEPAMMPAFLASLPPAAPGCAMPAAG